MTHRLFASLSHKSRVLFMTENDRIKTHPLQEKYYPHSGAKGLHAEMRCLIQYISRDLAQLARGGKRLPKLKYCTLRVWRHTKDGKLALAKPCTGCQTALDEFGVGKVVYSTENGWMLLETKEKNTDDK